MSEIDHKQLLIDLLASLRLCDHLGDVYGDCYKVAKLAGLMEDYDENASYFFDECVDSPIESSDYHHFGTYLEREKSAQCLWGRKDK